MTLQEGMTLVNDRLLTIYSEGEAESITKLLLENLTGVPAIELKWKGEQSLTAQQQHNLDDALIQLMDHKPVQYVIGCTWFCDLCFQVDNKVLIPRPETEELVRWVISTHAASAKPVRILEIGTGSGCIAISLKKALHHAEIVAVDISAGALEIAKKNAAALDADISFMQLDFLDQNNWSSLEKFDIIVSNPPYIPVTEKEKLDRNVVDWEPSDALFVPENDHLLFYRKMAEFGKTHLQHHAEMFVECHQDYANETGELFESLGYNTEVKKDIFENDRMVRAALIAPAG